MKGRTPSAAEKAHMALVGDLPCIACEKDGYFNDYVSLHHTDGRVKAGAHFKVIPLCAPHHQHDDSDLMLRIAVHPYKARFEKLYGTSEELIDEIKVKIEAKKLNQKKVRRILCEFAE